MSTGEQPPFPETEPDRPFLLFQREHSGFHGGNADDPAALVATIAERLRKRMPSGWTRVDAVFALTVTDEVAQVFYRDNDTSARADVDPDILTLAREHRSHTAAVGERLWWRMAVGATLDGDTEVNYDYGERRFPEEYLLSPAAYRADLRAFPRATVPIWLAAYVDHRDRQIRPPRHAAQMARHDRAEDVRAVTITDDEFPPLSLIWARWSALAAACAAIGLPFGPQVRASTAWYEDASGGGSTLCLLPHNRAVLSGGQWDPPVLDTVYNHGADMPDFYAGAPDWVTDLVLNRRAASGLLSFCYWWEGEAWHRAASLPAEELAGAIPPVTTAEATRDLITELAEHEPSDELRLAAGQLVSAVSVQVATRDYLERVFDTARHDVDHAFQTLVLAGATAVELPALPSAEAIESVRAYFAKHRLDATDYPLEELVAERISVGWLVWVPPPPNKLVFGRAMFYVADDRVVERASSSIPLDEYVTGFEHRFRRRQRY